MKKLFILALFLLCSFAFAFAQPPGFLGKRDILRYDFYAMPSNLFNRKNSGLSNYNTSHGFAYERISSRRSVKGINLMLIKFPPKYPGHDLEDHSVVTFGFHGRTFPFYSRGHLAPIGAFFRYSINFGVSSSLRQTHYFMDYGFGMGYATIIGDAITFDIAVRYALADFLHSAADGIVPTTNHQYYAAQEITQTEFCKMQFGFGILLSKRPSPSTQKSPVNVNEEN